VKLSVCGLDCSECDFHQTLCAGCREVEGKPFWTEIGCELFSCSLEKTLITVVIVLNYHVKCLLN